MRSTSSIEFANTMPFYKVYAFSNFSALNRKIDINKASPNTTSQSQSLERCRADYATHRVSEDLPDKGFRYRPLVPRYGWVFFGCYI